MNLIFFGNVSQLIRNNMSLADKDAIAPMCIYASAQAITFCTDAALLDVSTRGEGGFGSSDNAKQK